MNLTDATIIRLILIYCAVDWIKEGNSIRDWKKPWLAKFDKRQYIWKFDFFGQPGRAH